MLALYPTGSIESTEEISLLTPLVLMHPRTGSLSSFLLNERKIKYAYIVSFLGSLPAEYTKFKQSLEDPRLTAHSLLSPIGLFIEQASRFIPK